MKLDDGDMKLSKSLAEMASDRDRHNLSEHQSQMIETV